MCAGGVEWVAGVLRDLWGSWSPRVGLSNSGTCTPGRGSLCFKESDQRGRAGVGMKVCLGGSSVWENDVLKFLQHCRSYRLLWGQFGVVG